VLVYVQDNPKVETVIKKEVNEIEVEVPVYKEVEKIVEVEVEKIVEVEKVIEVEVEPQYTYNITSAEREMLARLVYREANVESLECQKAVVSVVINRLHSGYWGDTLKKVIYAPNQFSPANLIKETTPTEKNYQAVDEVLKNGVTLPPYVLYFRANYHFDWSGYKPYAQIDKTFFGYMEKDKNKYIGDTYE
jgi:hypothetical protein